MKDGYTYDVAVVLGGIKNAFGEKWSSLNDAQKNLITDNMYEFIRFERKGGFIEELKSFLKDHFHFSEKQFKKLYHHSANIDKVNKLLDKLPLGVNADREIQKIRNPIVITALFELRKLINAIIDEYGKPDEIKIELARDLKASKKLRNEVRNKQQKQERLHDKIKGELDKINQRPTHINILKYKLWEECDKKCPFTGNNIEVNQLFSGEVQIEHIHPWSRSLNDSFLNKTLCFAKENVAKGKRTPFEYYSSQGDEVWERRKQQALMCFKNKPDYPTAYNKFKWFIKKSHDDDFISRQLNDTRYISKEAKNYLAKICDKIMVAPGQMTAELRHKWGLNSILTEENLKTRDDHRHHAIDALVMACATISHLQELSKWNKYERNHELKEFPLPWKSFRGDAEKVANAILVSHKKTNSVLTTRKVKTKKNGTEYKNESIAARGELHEKTVYGLRHDNPKKTRQSFRRRIPISGLTPAMIRTIVDANIRENIIIPKIKSAGFEIDNKGKPIVKGKLQEKLFKTILSKPFYLKNKNGGDQVPIKKIRIKVSMKGNQLTEINQHVIPGNNHKIIIYKDSNDHLQYYPVSFWEAVERTLQEKKENQNFIPNPLPPNHSNGKILETFQQNDIFILGIEKTVNAKDKETIEKLSIKETSERLYIVQKIGGNDDYIEICFRHHLDSRLDKEAKKDYKYIKNFGTGKTGWQTFNPIKVKVSPIGRIEKV